MPRPEVSEKPIFSSRNHSRRSYNPEIDREAEDARLRRIEGQLAEQRDAPAEQQGQGSMPDQPAYGFEAFLERGLAEAGNRKGGGSDRKTGSVYGKGWAKGLTQGQAIEKARGMYANLSDEQRKGYEDRGNLRDVRSGRDIQAGADYKENRAKALGLTASPPSGPDSQGSGMAGSGSKFYEGGKAMQAARDRDTGVAPITTPQAATPPAAVTPAPPNPHNIGGTSRADRFAGAVNASVAKLGTEAAAAFGAAEAAMRPAPSINGQPIPARAAIPAGGLINGKPTSEVVGPRPTPTVFDKASGGMRPLNSPAAPAASPVPATTGNSAVQPAVSGPTGLPTQQAAAGTTSKPAESSPFDRLYAGGNAAQAATDKANGVAPFDAGKYRQHISTEFGKGNWNAGTPMSQPAAPMVAPSPPKNSFAAAPGKSPIDKLEGQ